MMRDRMNRKKTWFLAILLGMLLTVWAAGGFQETGEGIPGFFGMLYPEYCFSQVPEDGESQVPMERKLTFRWLRGL